MAVVVGLRQRLLGILGGSGCKARAVVVIAILVTMVLGQRLLEYS